MDKNIAALLRQDARTVHVVFNIDHPVDMDTFGDEPPPKRYGGAKTGYHIEPKVKTYTYVTHLDIAVGDTVIVETGGQPKIVKVIGVDADVKIEPNDTIEYGWVLQKIDMVAYIANRERNAQTESAVAEAMRNNLRRGLAQSVIAAIGDETTKSNLIALIGAPTPTDLA